MNLHEYQAKQLLAQYGVEVPGGQPCTTANEARSIAEKLFTEGHDMVVVKIQIHSGGRGKGVFKDGFKGGVHLCKSAEDVYAKATSMLGKTSYPLYSNPRKVGCRIQLPLTCHRHQ